MKPSSMGIDCTRRRLPYEVIGMSCLGVFRRRELRQYIITNILRLLGAPISAGLLGFPHGNIVFVHRRKDHSEEEGENVWIFVTSCDTLW